MIVAIFSDVHANLPALERFVKSTKDIADAYLCLGDVVNYGPWNDECLEVVHSLPGIIFLEGNHERLFLGTEEIQNEIPLVQEFFSHSIRYFSRTDLISSLPVSYELGVYSCSHTIDGKTIYADTAIEVTRNHFIGHTHHQYKVERSNWSIVNCGSIGQNRGRIEILNYALYDTASDSVKLLEESYPIERFMNELAARGYSESCREYYLKKLRRITA